MNEAQNFVFEDHGIRGGVVRLRETWLQTIAQHAYPQNVRDTLGQAVAATVLLGASLKDQPKISLQLQGDGPLRLLLVQCTGDLKVRATAQWNEHSAHAALLSSGRLAVNVDTGRENGFFQGIVPLVGPTLPDCIESYFARSEQLATRFFLFGDDQTVGGLVLQMLPGAEDTETFATACMLAETITAQEIATTDAASLLPRLFDGYTIRLFDARPVVHDCRCTPEHLAGIARMLGRDELESIIVEVGQVELTCEFCNRRFTYSQAQVDAVLRGEAPGPVLH
jgi:molecular chaperone Hsp33